MVPVLRPGDLLMVRQVEPSSLTPGSILVFRQNDRLVVHRLAAREGANLITRGDARPFMDPPVPATDILGRVESAQRNGRTLSLQPSLGQFILAFLLRRSEGFTSIYLRLLSRVRRFAASPAELQPIDPVRPYPKTRVTATQNLGAPVAAVPTGGGLHQNSTGRTNSGFA